MSHGDPDWSLTDEQFFYLQGYHSLIEEAFATDNHEWFDAFIAGEEFQSRFSAMSFDEAYDRFLEIVDPQ
jgi:hypothetical protein